MNWMAYVLRAYLQPAQTSNIYCAQRLTLSCLVYLIGCSSTLLWASSQVYILKGIEWYHIASYMVDFEMATMECMQLSLHYRPGRCIKMDSMYLTTWICTLGVWSNHACIIPCTNSLVHSMNPFYTHTHIHTWLYYVWYRSSPYPACLQIGRSGEHQHWHNHSICISNMTIHYQYMNGIEVYGCEQYIRPAQIIIGG